MSKHGHCTCHLWWDGERWRSVRVVLHDKDAVKFDAGLLHAICGMHKLLCNTINSIDSSDTI